MKILIVKSMCLSFAIFSLGALAQELRNTYVHHPDPLAHHAVLKVPAADDSNANATLYIEQKKLESLAIQDIPAKLVVTQAFGEPTTYDIVLSFIEKDWESMGETIWENRREPIYEEKRRGSQKVFSGEYRALPPTQIDSQVIKMKAELDFVAECGGDFAGQVVWTLKKTKTKRFLRYDVDHQTGEQRPVYSLSSKLSLESIAFRPN